MFPEGSGNKTQADRVGPVNVISNVLISSWRLSEAVCVWKSADQLTARAAATALETRFSLLGILFEWTALNKLEASGMLSLCDPLLGGGAGATRDPVVYCYSCVGLTVCVFITNTTSQR